MAKKGDRDRKPRRKRGDAARTAGRKRVRGSRAHPDAPYTKTDRMIAPRFGSAGSGGLEHEPGPERD